MNFGGGVISRSIMVESVADEFSLSREVDRISKERDRLTFLEGIAVAVNV